MITTINNEHKKLNVPNKREQNQTCLDSAEHEGLRPKGNVPNLRFPEFQGEWKRTIFKNVITLQRGSSPRPIIEYVTTSDDGVNWIKIGDMPHFGRIVTSTEEKITKEGAKKSRQVNKGDLILSNSMSYGLPYIMGIDGYIHDGWFVLKNFENTFDKDYLCNLLISSAIQNQYERLAAGGVVQNISSDLVNSVSVSIPTMMEQKKISSLLNLIDERIATQNKIIDKLQSLIKGIRNDVFGKLRKDIGLNAKVGDVLSYEQPQPYIVEDTEYTAGGTPVLTANKAFVLGYTSETDGIYDKGDCIIFDDFTLDCKYVDFPFKVKSSAIKILTAKNKELLRYTFEFLKYLDLSTDEHKRHYIAETQNQEFILPTTQIVRTIAHAFSTLSSRMQTIVKQRDMLELQKQYLLRQMFI